ncbi:MAG: 1,4-dihydroxy-6-naphthoate synthase [Spirochaetia bacterium]|nr:1,4-dihydroxy-6-naphthoate synthase [Spirochaetia bacterium]
MVLNTAISPCPNDTFSFYYLLHEKHENIQFKPKFYDIQKLNEGALKNKWDIVKASFLTGYKIKDKYDLLSSGSAIGFNAGPVLLSNSKKLLSKNKIKIGLPGKYTSAHFLWNYFYNSEKALFNKYEIEKKFMVFSDILTKLKMKEIDLGVVIHEGRFVYKDYNLYMQKDLGQYWEEKTKLPVPLGGIFIKKNINENIKKKVDTLLKNSVKKALEDRNKKVENYKNIFSFMSKKAQELQKDAIEKHIDYYVNDNTIRLSKTALTSIEKLYKEIEKYKNEF